MNVEDYHGPMTAIGVATECAAGFMTGNTTGCAATHLPPYFCCLLPAKNKKKFKAGHIIVFLRTKHI